ncbi:uncharacterized protein Z519_04859 [Cladophialophora bantiana CBS 173.52]|uniref:Uncharacterized protein n=1 Tax=Cladophialophora bantiana (strain ATCC 10958 / CBS 173.52 / CDC B-1940 / NIH 8579) TaxID=1442370 RepID=A0A0D2EY28_CLAB1|nr:uncharacterized protein Z519_04859 [Cladophialophora bantiana CBS 173.52]KIW94881.1 hypothetical protein Z519_04859 [Cladophialophora bantiana CBS 173.52]
MPLIIITGLPCSGKTYRAQQIASSLAGFIHSSADEPSILKRTIQIVPSYHASSDGVNSSSSIENTALRDQVYNNASHEKTARAEEFSSIKRALSKDNIVIADGLNYIKGYRYQLWCEAKAVGTRCCIVHVAAQEDECKRWNRERLRAFDEEVGGSGGDDGDGEGNWNATDKPTRHMQGESILGDLVPESHTAIYGDRVLENVNARSRSSSMDGLDNGDGEDAVARTLPDDTMTLKSLYINRADADPPSSTESKPPEDFPHQPTIHSPSIPIPPPTSSPPYSSSTLTSLIMRYEPPSPFSRWDTPLFTVPSSDATPPIREIWNAIYPPPSKPTSKKALSQLSPSQRSNANGNGNGTSEPFSSASVTTRDKPAVVKPHAATVLPRATASDALQTLESATMDVVRHLLAQSREQNLSQGGEGGDVLLSIPLPQPTHSSTNPAEPPTTVRLTIHIPPGLQLSQPMLQRLRRKYTQIQRGGIAHGQGYISGRRKIIEGFVEFLEAEWTAE